MSACFPNRDDAFSDNSLTRTVGTAFPSGPVTVMWHVYQRRLRPSDQYETYFAVGPTSFSGGNDYHVVNAFATSKQFAIGSNGGDNQSGDDIAEAGRWFKMAYTADSSGNQVFYYDIDAGVSSSENVTRTSPGGLIVLTASAVLKFGTVPWGGGEQMDCKIRCIKAWSRVLTTTQIQAEAAGGDVVDSADLWAQWPCISDANDISGNARHLSINGTVEFDGDTDPSDAPDQPTVIGVRHTDVVANATSITVLLPNGSNVSGRLVVVFVTKDGTGAMTWPAGWTELDEGNDGGAASRSACRYRVIDGTEGFDGTDDSISVTGASEEWHSTAVTVSNWHGTTAPEIATPATGDGTDPDPPSLNPANWDVEETLWLLYFGQDASGALLMASPMAVENYGSGNTVGVDGVTWGFGIGRGKVAAFNSGVWDMTDLDSWRAYTVGIRPVAAGGGGGIPSELGRGFHPGRGPINMARFHQTIQGHRIISGLVFRKTLSKIGTRTGSRQTHDS